MLNKIVDSVILERMLASSRGPNVAPPAPAPTAPRAPPPPQHHYPSQMPPFPPPMPVPTPPMYGHHLPAPQPTNYYRPPPPAPLAPAAPAPAKPAAGAEISEHQRVCRQPLPLATFNANLFFLGHGDASSHYDSSTNRRPCRDGKKRDHGVGTSIERCF